MFSNNVPQKKGEILKDRLSRILQQMEFMLGELMTRIEKFETRAPFVCWKIVSF
jgi:tetrahydromethanopterin S-methyltransferase subunit G